MVRGARRALRGPGCTSNGARRMVHGAWRVLHGAGCAAHGAWCMVHTCTAPCRLQRARHVVHGAQCKAL
eukprot:4084557-Lingulodinium_polyedra.AAC.1